MTDNDLVSQNALLERRLKRERAARQQAETLLTEKSVEVYETLQASKAIQKKLELALWASQESYWEWHAAQDTFEMRSFALASDSETIWRGTPLELLGRVHDDDIAALEFHWTMAVLGGRERIEIAFRFKLNHQYQWMRLRGRVLSRDENGSAIQIVGTTRDITRERKAEQSFHLMASAFASSREPMLVLSTDLKITECNAAFIKLAQLENKDQCIGLQLADLLADSQQQLQNIKDVHQVRFESTVLTRHDLHIPVDVSVALFETQYQTNSYLIATMRDISERKLNEARLRQMAMHDDLTGLQNRNGLRETTLEMISQGREFVVVFIDLDGFKQINDAAGHEEGDSSLKRVAQLLNNRFGDRGTVTRWGGDEFVVVIPGMSEDLARTACEILITDIEADVVHAQNTELRLSASIGLAAYPVHGESFEGLLQNADAAMYQAKMSGKGQVFIYQQGLIESMKERVSMLSDLRRAVSHRTLDFYIQGKYDLNGQLHGGELLCRWRSPLHGNVSPAVFIPLAEAHHLDQAIGLLALEAACDYISMFETHGMVVPMAINISANQLLDKGFIRRAVEVCKDAGVSTSLIEIELTESVFMRDERSALRSLQSLREEGFRLALDDFGTGFSSISYLRKFQFEVVKLDRSLLKDIHHDSKALSLFQGVIAMLNGLHLEIVVEGVETEEYLPLLRDVDVNSFQGYYFDKPMSYDLFLSKHTGL